MFRPISCAFVGVLVLSCTPLRAQVWTATNGNLWANPAANTKVGIGTQSPIRKLDVQDGSVNGRAIYGWAANTSGLSIGVTGATSSPGGYGGFFRGPVFALAGISDAASGYAVGVYGRCNSANGYAGQFDGAGYFSGKLLVNGMVEAGGGYKFPDGTTQTTAFTGGSGSGPWGQSGSTVYYTGGPVGVGVNNPQAQLEVYDAASTGVALFAEASVGTPGNRAALFQGDVSVNGVASVGISNVNPSGALQVFDAANVGNALYAEAGTTPGDRAAWFEGNVRINGMLTKSGGTFKIDHPLDPANKYLSHSFVESPDMMNVYNGVVVLDENGNAEVALPEYFEALNCDFRYSLTCIGGFAPVYIATEVRDNRFSIAGGMCGLRVSWQVTGVRQDPWAKAHRVVPVEEKTGDERGQYLNPGVYGQPESLGVGRSRKVPAAAPTH